MPRLKRKYNEEMKGALNEKFKYSNVMKTPALVKVVVNMGIAKGSDDKSVVQQLQDELGMITGQKPILTRAKKAISNFKLREGQPIGVKVTLRGKRMYDFIDRFINIVVPQIRDFRGFNSKTDGRGCYTLGIDDQQVFPEINLDKVKHVQGMNITFVTSAHTDDECIELLRLMGLPLKNHPVAVNL